MPLIAPRGSPSARIWLLTEMPFSTDIPKKTMYSGGMGYAFEKMLSEVKLDIRDFYIATRRPDTDNPKDYDGALEQTLLQSKPPFILAVGETASYFLPELRQQAKQDSYLTQLNKYCGSLLQSSRLNWPHYIMPILGMEKLMSDWTERNVTTYVDLGKLREEIIYWHSANRLQPLRARNLLFHEMDDDEVLFNLDSFRSYPRLSEDIESVYPRKGSAYYRMHPGYPITLGVAPSPDIGISFNLFRKTPAASRAIWRKLDQLHSSCEIIGQNFFNFDSLFYNALGLSIDKNRFIDTLHRHHILWPELPHKLQFLTRQYTRQPYYKDEGKQWSIRDLNGLRRYNCLDACVTYEVYEEQKVEFRQKPHLAA